MNQHPAPAANPVNTIFIVKHPAWSLQAAEHARHQGRALYRTALKQPPDPAAWYPDDHYQLSPSRALPAIKVPLIF